MLSAIEAGQDADVDGALRSSGRTRESELGIREEAIELIKKRNPLAETNDTNLHLSELRDHAICRRGWSG